MPARSRLLPLAAVGALVLITSTCGEEPTRPTEPRLGPGGPRLAVAGPSGIGLGTLGGASSLASAANDGGEVVGTSATAGGALHAFRWTSAGGMQDLGTLGGAESHAAGVNTAGEIVGAAAVATGELHAFRWTAGGGMQDLGTGAGTASGAVMVNDASAVTGWVDAAGTRRAFVWTSSGGLQDIGTLGGAHSEPAAINDAGTVVGWSAIGAGDEHAFRWRSGFGMEDLGTLGGATSRALAVNAGGLVVGWATNAAGERRAAAWTALTAQDLGSLGGATSEALAVNDAGTVVGHSLTATGAQHAFAWTSAGGMVDLGTLPGGTTSTATAINDAGDVAGIGDTPTGPHAFVWTAGGGMQDLGAVSGAELREVRAVDGSRRVVANVRDGGGADRAVRLFMVTNAAPTASAGGPYTGTEGVAVAFDAAGSTDPDGDPLSYRWDFNGDGTTDLTTATPSASHAYPDEGTFTAALTVVDDDNATSSATAAVTIANSAPTVTIPATATATAGSSFTLAGTAADAGAGDGPWSVQYEWGDGTSATTASLADLSGGLSASHSYARGGSYTVRVTVTDVDGASGQGELALTVASQALVVSIGGPYAGTEGTAIAFDASGSSDPDGDPLTYSWSFGDGTTGSGAKPTHAYADNGSYTVTLTVSDGNGATGSATTAVTVANAPPVVSAGPDATILAGQTFSLGGTFSDAGTADANWTYTITWGDGTSVPATALTAQGAVTGSHVYPAPGSYTATLTVTDKDGAGVSDQAVVTVGATAPTARAGGPYSGTEGAAVGFDGSTSTDPNGDALTYQWSFGDGTTGTGVKPTHVYVDNGTYTVTLTVNDGNGNSSSATATATIANAAPVVNAGPDATINEGQTFTLSATFSDAGTADAPWKYTINWGDGVTTPAANLTSQGAVTGSHVYPTPGTYTVTLTVTDKNGAGVSDQLVLAVAAIRPIARPGGPYTGTEGTAVQFDGSTSSDPNGDVLTYSWSFGDGATATGPKPTRTYANNGTYTVTLTVRDPSGNTNFASTTATIANAPPVVNAGADAAIDEARPAATIDLNASFTDPGTADGAWSYTINWGDGGTKSGSLTTQGAIKASRAYAAPGTYTTTVSVTDKDGAKGTDVVVFTVRAVFPDARPGGPYTGNEGQPIAFDGSTSTDPNGDALTYAWDFNGDGVNDATTAAASYTYPDNGAFTARLIVADPAGHADTATVGVTVKSVVGTVTAGPDGSVSAGGTFTLDASFSDGAADGPWTYEIAWGDGPITYGAMAAPGAITVGHQYATPGSYTVTLTVTDKDGGSSSDAAVVTVTTFANPVAAVNGPYAANEGAYIQFSSAGSTDPNGQTLSYAWSFGDGTTSSLPNPKKAYTDDGTFDVRLIVTSHSGGTDTAATTATVANVAPTASFTAPYSLTEGTAYTLSLSGNDAGSIDRGSLEYAHDCGQGSGLTPWSTEKSITCPALADQQSLTLQGQVRDKDGAVTAYTKTINATNAVPAVAFAATSPTTIAPGTTVTFEGSFTDKGASDGPWTYTINWGDGTPATTGTEAPGVTIAAGHQYDKPGTWYATLNVKDKDGGSGTSARVTVTTSNDPPVADANGPYTGAEGAYIQFSSAGSSDPNGQTLTYTWSFGDGTTSSLANPKKAYADNGSYAVSLTVKDASGATATSTATATIDNAAPTGSFTTAPSLIPEGTAYTLTLSGTDPGTADRPSLEYAFDCGQGDGLGPWSTTKTASCPALADQGPLTLHGQVRDKDGAVTAYTKTLTATNATPVVTLAATSPTSITIGGSVSVEGSFTDKGASDGPWTYTINWGDYTPATTGTALPGETIAATHPYARTGTFNVRLYVKDKDGASGTSAATTVVVSP